MTGAIAIYHKMRAWKWPFHVVPTSLLALCTACNVISTCNNTWHNFSQLKNYNLPWHLPKLKHLRVIIWAQRYCTYPWHDTNKQQWRLWIFSFIHPFHQGQYVSFSWVVSKWSGPEISPVASCCVDFVDVQLFTLSQKNNPLPFSTRCVSFIPTIRATKTHTLSPLLRASHLFIM